MYCAPSSSSAAASKFNVSTFSSRVDDYSEIFGGSGASRGGSSIPVLGVPKLHERKASVDVRSSKLDYSNVFGGCKTEGDKPVSSKENGAFPDNNLCERMTEGNHLKSARVLPAGDDRKQTSVGGAKVQNNYDRKRSSSRDELFNAWETNPSSSPSISSPLYKGKVEL